jgi:flagellar motor switch protein FliN
MTPLEEIARFADVPIDIEALLDRRMMRVRDLLSLDRGQLIPLTRSAGDSAEILAGGASFGSGEIVVVENAMAIRITDFAPEPLAGRLGASGAAALPHWTA